MIDPIVATLGLMLHAKAIAHVVLNCVIGGPVKTADEIVTRLLAHQSIAKTLARGFRLIRTVGRTGEQQRPVVGARTRA